MCKKQTSISHGSTESEIISLDAGLRLDGIPALDLWDLIVLVLGNTIQTHDRTVQPVVNCDKDHGPNKRSQGTINVLNNIDCVPSNVQFSHQEALLYVIEDNEAVIKMIIRKDHNNIQEKSESKRNRDQWWVLLQRLPRIPHLRRQKARGREAMEIRIPGVRTLRKRIERGNPLWAATLEPRLAIITNNLLKALFQHAT